MASRGIRPRDIVTPAALRNALTVAIAMGGSTNVAAAQRRDRPRRRASTSGPRCSARTTSTTWLGACRCWSTCGPSATTPWWTSTPRAGCRSSSRSSSTPASSTVMRSPARARPWPSRSGGSIRRRPDQDVIYPVDKPFKETGGLRLLRGNLAPEGGAILKVAGVEGGVQDGVFTGRARVFNSERSLIEALDQHPDGFEDNDMVVIRYEGPRGAPGMPELLDPTSRITALCRERRHHHRADDRRAVLGGIGRPGHRPRRARGLPRRADRTRRGGRHHRGRPEHRPHRLHRTRRPRRGRGTARRPGGRTSRATAASTRTPRRSRTGCWRGCEPRRCPPSSAAAWRRPHRAERTHNDRAAPGRSEPFRAAARRSRGRRRRRWRRPGRAGRAS